MNKCGVSIKVTHLVSNQEKIGQYNHSAPNCEYSSEVERFVANEEVGIAKFPTRSKF